MTTTPAPILPDFGGPCLSNLAPALLAHLHAGTPPPGWVPAPVRSARQVVLLLLDGLGVEQMVERAPMVPTLSAAAASTMTTVAPSTTACALTSLTTGLPPAVHGLLGYRVQFGGEVLNVLAWRLGERDARRSLRPRDVQPFPAFPGGAGGAPVPVVARADYLCTGFSAAHLGSSVLHGWQNPSAIAVEVQGLLAAGHPLVYAYYDGIDRVAHARGLGPFYEAELRTVDRLVAGVLEVLPPGAVLVVTADHGQVEVGANIEVLGPDVMAGVTLLSGEGRFRWLHVSPGADDDVAAAAESAFGGVAWVRTRQQVIGEGWLGGEPVPAVADRLGDVAIVPFEPVAFLDPADTGEQRLAARHGSLTRAEMLVPLLAWPPT